MMEVNAIPFYDAVAALTMLQTMVTETGDAYSAEQKNAPVSGRTKKKGLKHLQVVLEACPAFGAKITEAATTRLIQRIQKNQCSYVEAACAIGEIRSRLRDELRQVKLFALNDTEAQLYAETVSLFGPDVSSKFAASILEDIDEAGKCLALGRSTATVFHLMRAMEAALQAFGNKLGIALPDTKVWQVLLDQVNKAIKAVPPKDPTTIAYAQIAANLYNVKLAWRNEVMHPKGNLYR